MSDTGEDKLFYLKKMRVLAEDILTLTSALELTGDPDLIDAEVDKYSALIDEREPLIEELGGLKNKAENTGAGARAGECKAEKEAVDEICKRILDCDRSHLNIIKRIRESAQSYIKDIKTGRKLNSVYQPVPDGTAAGVVDASQ